MHINIKDKFFNDWETETDTEKCVVCITLFGNEKSEYNADVCKIIRNVKDAYEDMLSLTYSKGSYDREKEQSYNCYAKNILQKKNSPN